MMKRLSTHVHVRDPETGRREVFGPSDDLPKWFDDVVTNPKVYATHSESEVEEAGAPERPANSASKDEWEEYAKSVGVDPSGMTKEKIQAETP